MQNYNYSGYPMYNSYSQNTYAFVDGIEAARAFQVRPGTMMLLMDSQQPMCYKKQANNMGQTVVFEIYDLVPHKDDAKQMDMYVTKEEFSKTISDLKALLGGVTNESVSHTNTDKSRV